jgi:hypothetical protein
MNSDLVPMLYGTINILKLLKRCKMTDVVHYALPLGFLGRIMNSLVVENKLKEILRSEKKLSMKCLIK